MKQSIRHFYTFIILAFATLVYVGCKDDTKHEKDCKKECCPENHACDEPCNDKCEKYDSNCKHKCASDEKCDHGSKRRKKCCADSECKDKSDSTDNSSALESDDTDPVEHEDAEVGD